MVDCKTVYPVDIAHVAPFVGARMHFLSMRSGDRVYKSLYFLITIAIHICFIKTFKLRMAGSVYFLHFFSLECSYLCVFF